MPALENHDRAHKDYVTKESGRLALQSEMTQETAEGARKENPPQSTKRQLYVIEPEAPKIQLADEVVIERLKAIRKLLMTKDPKDANLAARKIKDLSQDSGYPREVLEQLALSLDEQDDEIDKFRARIAKLLGDKS